MTTLPTRRAVFSWTLYDWANSAFATSVIAGFFPIFFKDFWSKGAEPTESTLWLAISVSSASLLVALFAPILGAMADQTHAKKRSLALFAGLGILSTLSLASVGEGDWVIAAILYALGTIGFLSSLVFYDSLIISVSGSSTVDQVSARAYGIGYLGGGLLFLLNVLAVQNPHWFGLQDSADAIRWSFVSVALWWALFSIPLFLYVPEPTAGRQMMLREGVRAGIRQVAQTFREIRKVKTIFHFLLAYWFYIDGVDTVIAMAVDYGKSVGFGTTELITALLMVQFVGFPFAYLMGFIGQRWGTKKTILVCLSVYVLVTVFGSRLDLQPYRLFGMEVSKFYTIAFMVAVVQGGTQALSRALYSRLIPKEKAAQFFGFYNMLGKFAAIIGPVLMGTVGRLTGNPRAGIQAIAVLFVIGGLILWRIDDRVTLPA